MKVSPWKTFCVSLNNKSIERLHYVRRWDTEITSLRRLIVHLKRRPHRDEKSKGGTLLQGSVNITQGSKIRKKSAVLQGSHEQIRLKINAFWIYFFPGGAVPI